MKNTIGRSDHSGIFLITGPVSSGKTKTCETLAAEFRARGLRVSGILSPQKLDGERKVEIRAFDLATGESRVLARRLSTESNEWAFDDQTIGWGNLVFARSVPTDVLVVDEIGPLEVEKGKGWTRALDAIASGQYQRALVSVRPSLLEKFLERWPSAKVLTL